MSRHTRYLATSRVLLLVAGLVSCGGGETAAPVAPTVSSLSVAPSAASLVTGESLALTATILLSDGSRAQRSPGWTSSAPAVATVGPDGQVVAVGPGTASISATSERKSGSALISVLAVSSVAITPSAPLLLEGDTLTMTAVATLSDGTNGSRAASWTSNSPAVVSVSSAGRVTAIASGTTTIVGTVGGTRGTATVSVARRIASVALNLTARAMITGESVTLTPTVRFADSAIATGQAVVFASTAPSVATVSATGVVTALSVGNASITATVQGRAGSAAIVVRAPAQTTPVAGAVTTQLIGPNGGTLSTTAGGVSYRLEIPAGAVPVETQIRMTPLSAVGNLPMSGGLIAAADFEPSGLRFARPARLRIGIAAPPRPGFTLGGFSIESSDKRTSRELAAANANEVVVLVEHFSSLGAGFGTLQELASLPHSPGRPAAGQPFVDDFIRLASTQPTAESLLLGALVSWFDLGVLPQLTAASSDEALVSALSEFSLWSEDAAAVYALRLNLNDPSLATRRTQWKQQVVPKLLAAIAGNNQVCAGAQSIQAMRNALFWQQQAQDLSVNTGALSRATVLDGLCGKIVVSSATLPDPVQSGFPNDLDAVVGLKLGTNPSLISMPASVSFSGAGVTFGKPSPANTDQNGQFTVAVTAQGNAAFSVTLVPCLVLAGATDVCGLRTVNSSTLDVSGQYTGRLSSTLRTPSGAIIGVSAPVNVTLVQNQNGVSGTYELMQFNGLRGTVSATLAGTQLLNFTLAQAAPCAGILNGLAIATVATRRLQSTYAGSDCAGTHTNGTSDLLPGSLTVRDVSGSWTEGFRSNGQPVNVWNVRQQGLTVTMGYAEFDVAAGELICRARFVATAFTGGDAYQVRLTENLVANPKFPVGTVFTWQPSLTTARGADVLPSFLGNRNLVLIPTNASC